MKYSIKVNEVRAKEGSNIKGFATVVFGDSFKITNIATDFNGELLVNWDYVIDAFDVEMIHSMFSENIKGLRLLIYS